MASSSGSEGSLTLQAKKNFALVTVRLAESTAIG
jgi:hypothetical protein